MKLLNDQKCYLNNKKIFTDVLGIGLEINETENKCSISSQNHDVL